MSVDFDNKGLGVCTFPKCPCFDGVECPLTHVLLPIPTPVSREAIEAFEREHFPELFEICHLDVRPKPPLLQALWANCKDL